MCNLVSIFLRKNKLNIEQVALVFVKQKKGKKKYSPDFLFNKLKSVIIENLKR